MAAYPAAYFSSNLGELYLPMRKPRPLFETTLAKPVQLEGSSIVHKAGAKVVLNMDFTSARFKRASFVPPRPGDLFLMEAEEDAEICKKLIADIKSTAKKVIYSELAKQGGITADEALRRDKDAKVVSHLDKELVYKLLVKGTSLLTQLVSAVEATANLLLPTPAGEPSKVRAERFSNLEDKLIAIAAHKSIPSPQSLPEWRIFDRANYIRDNMIHLKTKGDPFAHYADVYKLILDLDFEAAVKATIKIIEHIEQ